MCESASPAYITYKGKEEDGTLREIAYCDIKRLMFPNGWHYYIVAYVRDEEPPARKNGHGGGAETVGIDPGTSTVAVVADVSADCSRASRPSSKKNLKTLALKY